MRKKSYLLLPVVVPLPSSLPSLGLFVAARFSLRFKRSVFCGTSVNE